MLLPRRALTDADLMKYAKVMKVPHFRGVFMRNDLPKSGAVNVESAIVNLDDKDGPGTHWVAYKKIGDKVSYFDSFGNLRPPAELLTYLSVGSVNYNYENYQNYNTMECGHLCMKFLCQQLNRGDKYCLYKEVTRNRGVQSYSGCHG